MLSFEFEAAWGKGVGLSGLRLNALSNFEVLNQGNFDQEIVKKYNRKKI